MEDREIINLYFSRDESAISATDSKYGALCRKIIKNILSSDHDAEECLNDLYLSIWNKIPPTVPDNLRNYLCKSARNAALSMLRKNSALKRGREYEISLEELGELSQNDFQPDSALEEEINAFLGLLEPPTRRVFVRRYWFFDSIKEISASSGFGESKVKQMLKRTREKLRKYLTERGVKL